MTRRMRVVLDASALADNRATAGIGRYANSLIAELEARRDISVWVAQPARRPPREAWVVRFAWAQPGVAAEAVRHRADLVHALASDPALLWPLRRQVVTLHDALPWSRPSGGRRLTPAYLALQRRRLQGCAAVIAVSEAVAAEATSVVGVEEARVHVVPEAMSPVFTASPQAADGRLRREAGAPDAPYLLWVGSLKAHDPRKGLDGLLAAVRRSRHPRVAVVFAGAQGAEGGRLRRVGFDLGVNLVQTGFVSDEVLAALYRGAAAVLLPSTHEGFGLPALEAMASGTPLVAARSVNLPQLVDNSAVLVEPGNTEALAEAINRVLEEPDLVAGLRHRGPTTASRYSWRRTADLTVAVYEEVLRGL